MKTILMTVLLACALFGGACSRSDKPAETAAQATPTPDPKVVEAERVRQATLKAAVAEAERRQATVPAAETRRRVAPVHQSPTPGATPPESPPLSVPQP